VSKKEKTVIRQHTVYACRSVNMHVSMPTLCSNLRNSSWTRYARSLSCMLNTLSIRSHE
jgi:hypothetical protein